MFNRVLIAFFAMFASSAASATIVQFQTSMGDFEVNLYDQGTPETVANFLDYVEAGAYEDSIVHRSVKGFVVQGGGFVYSGDLPLDSIETYPPVVNEPEYSNVRATIAMAKKGGDANSASSQWFINLSNNSGTLDVDNGGFTVFGEVMLDGMDIVDAMADVPVYNAGGALASLPLRNYDPKAEVEADDSNFIMIYSVLVLDAAPDTAADAEPVPNTLIHAPPPVGKKKSSGGALAPIFLLAFAGLLWRRRLH